MYSPEEVIILQTKYEANPTQQTIAELCEELNKSKKSIIGKLSRMGIYQKVQYVSKTGETPISKNELVHKIADELSTTFERLEGLEKAPKNYLKNLLEAIK